MNTQSSRINNKRKFKINKVERKRQINGADAKTEVSQPDVKDLNISNTKSNDNNTFQISNNTEASIMKTKTNTNLTKQSNSANDKNPNPMSSSPPSSLGITNQTKFKKSGKYFKMSKLNRDKVHKTLDLSSTLLNELNLNEVKFQDLNRYLNQK